MTTSDKYIPKRVRKELDQVTSQMTHVILDAPQLAYQRALAAIEREAMQLRGTDYGRFMDKLAGGVALLYPHCDSDVDRDVWAALVMVLSRRNATMSETITRMCSEAK